jgi:threonine/homoserine/homoserine lactone efflux protein
MIACLGAGIVLGLSAGFGPGPLLALVVSQTLKHGIKEGVKVASAPLITDVPIIVMSVFVLSRLDDFRAILGSISLIGGLFVTYLAYESFRTGKLDARVQDIEPRSLRKGALVNALNPHPYVFWFSVGAATIIKAMKQDPFTAAAFLAGFYVCLVGAKVFVAALVGNSRDWFMGKACAYVMRVLAVLLLIFAFLLFRDGLDLLGISG